MTKHISYLITTFLLLLVSFNTVEQEQIIMTTNKQSVDIYMVGLGTATIDWGDSIKSKVEKLSTDFSCWSSITHKYRSVDNHTITISGNIKALDCSHNQLTKLDVSGNSSLIDLQCGYNLLTSLDVSNNIALRDLRFWNNELTNIDLTNNILLTTLLCMSNQLTSLDVIKNTALITLDCKNNLLTSLDIKNNTSLISLYCDFNQLTRLEVSGTMALRYLHCQSNQLSTDALNALFGTLNNTISSKYKFVYIHNNPGTDYCDISIATNNGWMVDTTF